jgi:HTH-type transcriptional regulator, competence development regulator
MPIPHTLGQILREQREARSLLLRQVAAALEIDTALLSKFERSERVPNKDQVIAFARYYGINMNEFLLAWLSDKITEDIKNEEIALDALKIAEVKIGLFRKNKKSL